MLIFNSLFTDHWALHKILLANSAKRHWIKLPKNRFKSFCISSSTNFSNITIFFPSSRNCNCFHCNFSDFFFHFFLQQIVRFYWQMPKSSNIQLSIAMKRFARWAVSVGLKWCKKHAGKLFLFHYFFSLKHVNNIRFHLHSFSAFVRMPKTKLISDSRE